MLDGRSFWALPVETAGRQLPRLPVRCGEALQLSRYWVLLQANAPRLRCYGGRIAVPALMNDLDMV
jgi:hypothetical protein